MTREPTTDEQDSAVLTLAEFLDNKDNIHRLRLEAYNADEGTPDYRGICARCGMVQVYWGIDCYVDGVPIGGDVLDWLENADDEFVAQVCLWSFGWREVKGKGLLCPVCYRKHCCECAASRDMFPEG